MSGERPKAPLRPEGISKVRPVENQKPKALTEGVAVPVAQQPELSKPGEQLWEPMLPKDREKIEVFVNDLAQNKEEILGQLETFLFKPNKTRDDAALAIYLDTVVKRDVLGVEPFASQQPGDEAHQESREYIALLATEHVAKA
jgi:hypothetical protein